MIRKMLCCVFLCVFAPEFAMAVINEGQLPHIIEYHLPPDKLQKAEHLYQLWIILYITNALFSIMLLVLMLRFRMGAIFRHWVEKVSHHQVIQAILFAPLLLGIIGVCNLPLQIFRHHLMREYELSVQGWGSWFWDWAVSGFGGLVLGVLFVCFFYTLVKISPKRWWLYSWLISSMIILLLVFIKPLFIDPLFHKFDSLALSQPQLLAEITKIAQKDGVNIDQSQIFVMQASDKMQTYNAYVAGIGSSKRVVIWDTVIKDMTVNEVVAVFAHEQGHYVLNHLWISSATAIFGLLLALYIVHKGVALILCRYGQNLNIRSLGDLASLPLIILMLSLFSLFGQPVISTFARYQEYQADLYGLRVMQGLVPNSTQVAANALQKLGERNLDVPDPNPLWVFWVYGHPSVSERIRLAINYRP